MHLTHVALHEVDMVHGCMVYTGCAEMAAVSCGTSRVSAVSNTTSVDIQKLTVKDIHSCRITCERSESAREWRIALYKSDHQSVRHRNVSGQEAD